MRTLINKLNYYDNDKIVIIKKDFFNDIEISIFNKDILIINKNELNNNKNLKFKEGSPNNIKTEVSNNTK